MAPVTPPYPLLHNFLFPASFSSDTVINNLRGCPGGLNIGEESGGHEGGAASALGQGVTGFQVAQGNLVSLFFPLGNEVVKEEIICVSLRRLGLPLASAGLFLPGAAPLTAADPGATGLRGLEKRHLRILGGPGTMSAGPVVAF